MSFSFVNLFLWIFYQTDIFSDEFFIVSQTASNKDKDTKENKQCTEKDVYRLHSDNSRGLPYQLKSDLQRGY